MSIRNQGLVTQRKFRLKHNIAEISHDRVDPITVLPNRGDRALSFFIPRTTNRCISFAFIELHLKLRLVSGIEGKPIDPNGTYIIPGFVPSTIFSNLVVRVNDTEVTSATNFPLLSKFLFLTQLDPERRKMLEQVNDFSSWDEENVSKKTEETEVKDSAGKTKKVKNTVWSLTSGRFPECNQRSTRFTRDDGRGSHTYSTFLMTELSGGGDKPLVLPPCDLSIDFIPAEPGRAILTDASDPDTRVEIIGAHLTVPRILPKNGVIPRSLHWNYLRTRITPIIVPKDRTEFHAVVMYSGLIGRRISLFLVNQDNWEGNYRHSVYRSYHNYVESIEVRAGSRVLPSSRIRADFEDRESNEMYMYVADSLKWSLKKTGALDLMDKTTWVKGGFVWSADTTVDQSADAGYKGIAESGSVNLSINFTKKTTKQVVAVVFTESTAELKIDSEGSVNVSD